MLDHIIIPARGGSKRIKDKNLAPFLGRPMVLRTVELSSGLGKHVVVTSDSDRILDCVCKEFCGESRGHFEGVLKIGSYVLIKRSPELSDDFTPTLPVVIDALKQMHISLDDSVCVLYPTAMFASREHILDSLCLLNDTHLSAEYVVSVVRNDKFHRSMCVDGNGFLNPIFGAYLNERTQDLPIVYNDAGQFYVGRAKSFLSNLSLLGPHSFAYDIGVARDIDTMDDLYTAESIYRTLRGCL